ncbi:MAG TPA: ATP-binding protein [Byssovorax sp.]
MYCVLAYGRRHTEPAVFVFGALNAALVLLAGGHAIALVAAPVVASRGAFVGESGRVLATALLVHHVLLFADVPRPRRALALLYGSAAALLVANALGLVSRYDALRVGEVRLPLFSLPDVSLPSAPLGGFVAALTLAASLGAPITLGRGVLRGRPDGLVFASAILLAVAAANDALHALGLVPGPPLAEIGFAGYATAVTLTWMFRNTGSRRELERRASEVRKKSRELAGAYAQLRADKEELVRKEQLAAVGELSAVIAHEVRNPLAIISNAVATLRRGQIEAADRETLLAILDEESSRLNRIVGDLLRYARPVDVQRQFVSVRELLDRTLSLVANQTDLVVDVVEEGEPPRIWADANLLRQALDNLVTNAMQAMAGGGVLGVTLTARECGGEPGVELVIQDTGEGMDTQVRRRALDPFFTTRPSGTGLGLAIVARIIDAHGGSLHIESAAGSGTAVTVELPVSAEGDPLEQDGDDERPSEVPLPAELKRAMGRR